MTAVIRELFGYIWKRTHACLWREKLLLLYCSASAVHLQAGFPVLNTLRSYSIRAKQQKKLDHCWKIIRHMLALNYLAIQTVTQFFPGLKHVIIVLQLFVSTMTFKLLVLWYWQLTCVLFWKHDPKCLIFVCLKKIKNKSTYKKLWLKWKIS